MISLLPKASKAGLDPMDYGEVPEVATVCKLENRHFFMGKLWDNHHKLGENHHF